MLYKTPLKYDRERREIIPAEMASFPCLCRWTNLNWYRKKNIPWHWHTELEIDCVEQGQLEIRTPDQIVTAGRGEIIFVNTGVLHTCRSVGEEPCHYYTFIVDMHFLSGLYNSVFEEKYFLPVLRNTGLQVWLARPDTLPRMKMSELVMSAVELCREEPEGYEFDLRAQLCDFWRLLVKDTEGIRSVSAPRNMADTERIKAMMSFIREHRSEKLTLEQIAASANISVRECTRCFQRCINSTPTAYLTQSRIRMATRLLAETDRSILDISEECGFSSSSYFGKVFREVVGCTPKEYRESCLT